MRTAIFEAMALSLWRDRAAFALAFVLPAAIFAIFALVFSSAAGGEMKIRLAVHASDPGGAALVAALREAPEIARLIEVESAAAGAAAVQAGRADAGVAIGAAAPSGPPQIVFQADATREGAIVLVEGLFSRLLPAQGAAPAAFTRSLVNPVNSRAPMAAYFAAGVAMLFLFLSGFQSALTLLEEREAGVLERVASGPAGIAAAIDGKFLFIVLQGLAQVAVILATAALAFGVDLGHAPGALALAILAAAVAAAGATLGITALCRSRAQAHATGTVISLVAAALGGSMAPRFLMPQEIQAIGALTPNALGIEAFSASLWKGGGLTAALEPALALVAIGLAGLALAHLAARVTLRPDA